MHLYSALYGKKMRGENKAPAGPSSQQWRQRAAAKQLRATIGWARSWSVLYS